MSAEQEPISGFTVNTTHDGAELIMAKGGVFTGYQLSDGEVLILIRYLLDTLPEAVRIDPNNAAFFDTNKPNPFTESVARAICNEK